MSNVNKNEHLILSILPWCQKVLGVFVQGAQKALSYIIIIPQ